MAQTDNQNSLLPEGNGISDGSGMKRRGRPKSLRRSVPFEVRMPQEVSDALREVSRRQFTTIAEYTRRALLAQLEHDGICPSVAEDRGEGHTLDRVANEAGCRWATAKEQQKVH
jgi:hypothetical protein